MRPPPARVQDAAKTQSNDKKLRVMQSRNANVWPNWRIIISVVLCVSGIVVSIVTWPDIPRCAFMYKIFLCVGTFLCVVHGTQKEFKIASNAWRTYACLIIMLLLVAVAPTLLVTLPSTCNPPVLTRAWMYVWQATVAAYAGHFLRKSCRTMKSSQNVRKPLINTAQVL